MSSPYIAAVAPGHTGALEPGTPGAAIARVALLGAGTAAVAVICIAGAVQLQPISTSNLNRLVAQAATPTRFQTCTTANGVRYCLYPDFTTLRSSLERPVDGVLAYVPVRPDQATAPVTPTSLARSPPAITLAMIAFCWFTPGVKDLLVTGPATPRTATIAWYIIAAASLAITAAAMRDTWHRYTRRRR